ncbi:hypothetical protein JTE90_018262 [Oedothorax gibbosus]|nr:hypothetical protein JTE90_018262 [Oedothorax gibbosus]
MLRFIKEETVGSLKGSKLLDVDTKNFDTFLPLKRINVGEATKRALSQLNDVKEARMAMRSFLMKLCNLLKDALPLTNPVLKYLEKLHPAMRHVKDAVKRYGGVCAVPISGKLLNSVAKSHSVYAAALDAEKKLEEESKKRAHDDEKFENEAKKLKTETEEIIKATNKKIKNIQDDITAAQSCLNEGNERLQSAIKKKSFHDMKIASAMIDAASKQLKQNSELLNAEQVKSTKLQLNLNAKLFNLSSKK